jgi:hypothetical protein
MKRTEQDGLLLEEMKRAVFVTASVIVKALAGAVVDDYSIERRQDFAPMNVS